MSCQECRFHRTESEGEYGEYKWHFCEKNPRYANLRSFPFAKKMPCFVVDFWFSEFAAETAYGEKWSMEKALDLYWKKYGEDLGK